MGAIEKKPVYKDTVYKLLAKKPMTARAFSNAMGRNNYWFASHVSKTKFLMFSKPDILLACSILGCTPEELTEVPEATRPPKTQATSPDDMAELKAIIREGFQMIHADLRALLAEWKPKPPTPPKYEIKEREQD